MSIALESDWKRKAFRLFQELDPARQEIALRALDRLAREETAVEELIHWAQTEAAAARAAA
jgi:hypothetical protein